MGGFEITRVEAEKVLLDLVDPLSLEGVALSNLAGRVAGETLRAPKNIPDTPRSRVDGYCMRSLDAVGAKPDRPVFLPIAFAVAPEDPLRRLPRGTSARVFTGSPLPPEVDTCIPQEAVEERPDGILLSMPPKPGYVTMPGSRISQGLKVVNKGDRIHPFQVGLIADTGRASLQCHRTPVVALLATGNELGMPGNTEGLLPASNLYTLGASLQALGVHSRMLGIAPDDPHHLAAIVRRNRDMDLLVTTGGTGPGERDLIHAGMEILHAQCLFKGVEMKPGHHTSAYLLDKGLLLALSGPPMAAFVTFHALAKPAILKMAGSNPTPPERARLHANIPSSNRETLVPVTLRGQEPRAYPWQPGECPEGILIIPPDAEPGFGREFELLRI